MKPYHKIQTVFDRDPDNKFRTLIGGAWAWPEFEYLQNNQWEFSEKVDGTNIRVTWDGEKVTFGGKTDQAQIYAPLITRLLELFPKAKMAEKFEDDPVCLYGEGHGAKIQKGGGNYKPDGVDFVLFDVKIDAWWLQREDVRDIANHFGVKDAPLIGRGNLHEMVTAGEMGFKSTWGDFTAEGIVARPATELLNRDGKRIITKIKYKDFQ